VRAVRRLAALTIVATAAVAAWAPPAVASSLYSRVLHVYQTSGGTIPACEFTSSQLESVLKSSDTYENQYFADFGNAINNALSQRASGACTSSPQTAAAGPVHAEPPLKLGPVTAATGASVPAPIVLLAALGGLLLVVAAVGGLARARGWDPAWAATWRHGWSEAEYRIGGGWESVRDRLGGSVPPLPHRRSPAVKNPSGRRGPGDPHDPRPRDGD
jgi:hypothetical protein